jgi:hypothetical protein
MAVVVATMASLGAKVSKARPWMPMHVHAHGDRMAMPWRGRGDGARQQGRRAFAVVLRHTGGVDRLGSSQGMQRCRLGGLAVAVHTHVGIGFTRATAWPRKAQRR